MCVAIHKLAGIKLDPEIYEESFRMHGDGVGIAYVDEEKNSLIIEKGFMKKKEAIEAILKHEDKELLIHFRKVSKGPVNEENCHPFEAFSNMDGELDENGEATEFTDDNPRFQFAIAHNGTFNISPANNMSDTQTLMVQVLRPWLRRDPWLFDHHYARFVWMGYCDKGFGTKNKFVVMRYDRLKKKLDVEIVNRAEGMEYQKCWFSNYTWIPTGPKWGHARGGTQYNGNGAMGVVNHGYGGGSEDSYCNIITNKKNFPSTIPKSEDPGWGEQYPDHVGWQWHGGQKKFYNIITGASLEALRYRKDMQDEYEMDGTKYKRSAMNISSIENDAQKKRGNSSESSPDLPQLSFNSKTNPVSDANKEINVPRDHDVENDAWARAVELAEGAFNGCINHLSKKDRKALIRIAKDYLREAYDKDVSRNTNVNQACAVLRNDFLEAFPFAKNWTLLQVDHHIIARGGFEAAATDAIRMRHENQQMGMGIGL